MTLYPAFFTQVTNVSDKNAAKERFRLDVDTCTDFFEGIKSKARREGAEYTSFAPFNFITVREGEKPYMLV